MNFPGNAGAFLSAAAVVHYDGAPVGPQAKADQNDESAHREQRDLKPAGLPKEDLDGLQ
jgi:hypothetical protein